MWVVVGGLFGGEVDITRCYYYTQSVAGPMIPISLSVGSFPKTKVRAIRIWAQTRGAGHSLMGSKVNYSLTAYPA